MTRKSEPIPTEIHEKQVGKTFLLQALKTQVGQDPERWAIKACHRDDPDLQVMAYAGLVPYDDPAEGLRAGDLYGIFGQNPQSWIPAEAFQMDWVIQNHLNEGTLSYLTDLMPAGTSVLIQEGGLMIVSGDLHMTPPKALPAVPRAGGDEILNGYYQQINPDKAVIVLQGKTVDTRILRQLIINAAQQHADAASMRRAMDAVVRAGHRLQEAILDRDTPTALFQDIRKIKSAVFHIAMATHGNVGRMLDMVITHSLSQPLSPDALELGREVMRTEDPVAITAAVLAEAVIDYFPDTTPQSNIMRRIVASRYANCRPGAEPTEVIGLVQSAAGKLMLRGKDHGEVPDMDKPGRRPDNTHTIAMPGNIP